MINGDHSVVELPRFIIPLRLIILGRLKRHFGLPYRNPTYKVIDFVPPLGVGNEFSKFQIVALVQICHFQLFSIEVLWRELHQSKLVPGWVLRHLRNAHLDILAEVLVKQFQLLKLPPIGQLYRTGPTTLPNDLPEPHLGVALEGLVEGLL